MRRKRGRPVQGIVPLDKPSGMSSNEALQRVKRLFQARKAGHTGSLDRQASGLLPLCLGEATKISGFLLNASKRYRARFRLGVRTTTGDSEGEVLERRPVPVFGRAELEQVLARFRGDIRQTPPMHSAVKHHGQRLYRLAHQGLVVEREARTVQVHELTLLDVTEGAVDVEVYCSKGTFVRTLAEDVGEALGCGAHIESLRRIAAGPFGEDDMVTLEALEARAREGLEALDAVVLPMETAVSEWPDVHLPEGVAFYLRKGQPVMVPHAPTEGWVRIYGEGRGFLGVGEVLDDGRIAPRRLVNA